MTTISRNAQIERAAKLRAAIIALLAKCDNLTRDKIYSHVGILMGELDYKIHMLDNVLYLMSKSGLIHKCKGKENRVIYSLSAFVQSPPTKVIVDASITAKPKLAQAPDVPAMTIDIVKSTGRVRLSFKGMTIEIGIVD